MTNNSLDFLLNLRADTTGFDQGINGSKFAVNALVGALASLGIGLGAKELIEAADSYATLSAKIQQTTKESGNFEQAMSGVHQIALQTNSTLDNTGTLFTRLNTVAKDMGKSQQFALEMTSTVTKAIQLGGSSTQEAEAAVQQFIQAMQGGVLRGEEFNSIMESGYGLAEALAKGLGVTTGELRKMAEAGELSAERVLTALEKQKAGVDAQYAEMPLTIGNALQKIATSWQILIGEMDQANDASATVAQWLSVLADNLDVVEVLLNDIGDGFVWFGDQLKKIDLQTIEALKTALLSAYDAIKSLGSTIGTVFETTVDVINTTLGQIFNFSSGIDAATDKTNGFTKALQAVNVVFGFISDGFKALNIGINLIIGAAYDAAGAFSYWKSKITFGDTSAQAVKDFEVMSAKAQEYYKKSSDAAMEFKSAGVEAIRQIGLTQDEKNAERIANNQKTLTDLKAQEAQHVSDYKAISDERIKLQQQLVDARKSGDQSAIDAAVAGLAELDKKEKEYQAESKKISDEKIKAAQDLVNAQIEASTKGGVALSDTAKKTIEASVAAQGLAVEFDKTGKAIVKAIEQEAGGAVVSLETQLGQGRKAAAVFGIDLDTALNKVSDGFTANKSSLDDFAKNLESLGATGQQAADLTYEAWQKWLSEAKSPAEVDAAIAKLQELAEQGKITGEQLKVGIDLAKASAKDLSPELEAAREAGKALGIDIDKTANIMSQGFGQGSANLDTLKQKLEEVGITGQEASNTLYQGWQAWLEKADSQVEIDAAKAKLQEFESQGVFSTRQVENGMLALKLQTQKAAEATDETTEAFKRLGIQTKEQLKLDAELALAAFNKVQASGQATADGLKQAYERVMQAAIASGDQAVIANAKAKASSLGLQVQVDETGKASVKTMNELSNSVENVGRTASGSAAQGFRELGRVAKQEAEEVAETWEQAMARVDKERKAQAAETAKGLGQMADGQNQMAQDFYDQLIAGGMEKGRAEELKNEAITRMNNQLRTALNGGTAQGRFEAQAGYNSSQAWMQEILDGLDSKGSIGSSSPKISAPNIEAPSIQQIKMPNIDTGPSKTVTYRFEFGGQDIEFQGDPSQQDMVNSFFNQLEQAKKRM
ncbi:tape measure protein [Acinetobacter junii]|uniref:Tape measure protein n=1 Tax=Acinetobacter junii TaxID=40215 RepID=A0AAW5RD53_ACIJU|nr:tape measure protein [Acinetobacter junii]MCU4397360.1 tape measure protein [Acinetobacter junii]